jgi:hypothetical protein
MQLHRSECSFRATCSRMIGLTLFSVTRSTWNERTRLPFSLRSIREPTGRFLLSGCSPRSPVPRFFRPDINFVYFHDSSKLVKNVPILNSMLDCLIRTSYRIPIFFAGTEEMSDIFTISREVDLPSIPPIRQRAGKLC